MAFAVLHITARSLREVIGADPAATVIVACQSLFALDIAIARFPSDKRAISDAFFSETAEALKTPRAFGFT